MGVLDSKSVLLIITPSNTIKMDSAEIVYATVDEIIGKTGKWPPQTHDFRLQAQEEVLHKLRSASLALRTEPLSETWKAQLERGTSSLCSSQSVRPEDCAEQTFAVTWLVSTAELLQWTRILSPPPRLDMRPLQSQAGYERVHFDC